MGRGVWARGLMGTHGIVSGKPFLYIPERRLPYSMASGGNMGILRIGGVGITHGACNNVAQMPSIVAICRLRV